MTKQTTTHALETATGQKAEPLSLEAVTGPAKGARFELKPGLCTVGSGDGCDFVLEDGSVSRRHATIELRAGGVRVRDLGSKNGSRYLGAKLADAVVPAGATFQLGRTTLRVAVEQRSLPLSDSSELCGLLGASVAMRALFHRIEKVAPLDTTVLVLGETGTGKEAVARAVHTLSPRSKRPLVVIDCAAAGASTLESELFGHVKGAFTGAAKDRAGPFEAASDGTVLLDEVGELELSLQSRLLRVLEAREVKRVGDNRVRPVRCRVLATSARPLEREAKAGTFRSDVFFRLSGTVLEVPPLRERRDDIPLLARAFARAATGVDVELERSTLASLQAEPWPGNVRELKNAIERVVALGESPVREAPPERAAADMQPFLAAREALLEGFERDYLKALLSRHGKNLAEAARAAGVARSFFYKLLERHKLRHGS